MAEVEFRDGMHWVPDHLSDMMQGLDTHRYTKDEAIYQANQRLSRDHLAKIQHDTIAEHFKNRRTGE